MAMVTDQVTTVGAYATGLLGGFLLLMLVIHAYARWTIRNVDQREDA
jgi:hypothetical protein